MENANHNIDDFFRERLGDYTETPPPAVWNDLQQSLATKTPPLGHFSANLLNYLILATTVIGVTLLSLRYLNSSNKQESSVQIVAQTTSEATQQPTGSAVAFSVPGTPVGAPQAAAKEENAQTSEKTEQNRLEPAKASTDQGTTVPLSNGQQTGNTQKSVLTANNAHNVQRSGNVLKNSTTVYSAGNKSVSGSSLPIVSSQSDAGMSATGSNTSIPLQMPGSTNNAEVASANTAVEQPGTVFSSSGITPVENNSGESRNGEAKSPAKTFKEVQSGAPANSEIPAGANSEKKNKFGAKDKWEIWANAGLEKSGGNMAYGSVIAPSIQFNVSNRFSVSAQPGIRTQVIASHKLSGNQTYYPVNNDGSIILADSTPVIGYPDTNIIGWIRDYKYSQTHDSVSRKYSVGGVYTSFDLPLMVSFRVTPHFTLNSGVVVNFNARMSINSNTTVFRNIIKEENVSYFTPIYDPVTVPKPVSQVISYDGMPPTESKTPLYTAPGGFLITCGYNVGCSYDFLDRFRVDFSAQKSSVPANTIGGYNINSVFDQWYFRILFGYRIF